MNEYIPPYDIGMVFVSPFKEHKVYAPDGTWHWEPLQPTHKTTGIPAIDNFFQWLSAGNHYDRKDYYVSQHIYEPRPGIEYSYEEHRHSRAIFVSYKRRKKGVQGVLTPHLHGAFMLLFGLPMQIVQQHYSLRLACEYLAYTSLPIGVIALRSGLICNSHMSRLFRSFYHSTPSSIRKQIRKERNITLIDNVR